MRTCGGFVALESPPIHAFLIYFVGGGIFLVLVVVAIVAGYLLSRP